MHILNDTQKFLIREINKSVDKSITIIQLLDKQIEKLSSKIVIDLFDSTVTVELFYDQTLYGKKLNLFRYKTIQKLERKIIFVRNLIKYLEKENMVVVYNSRINGDKKSFAIGSKINNHQGSMKISFEERVINDFLLTIANTTIISTPDLLSMQKNGFRSKVDNDFRIQLKWTRIAIILSAIIGFSGIYLTSQSSSTDKLNELTERISKNNIMISENTKTIDLELKKYNEKIDELYTHLKSSKSTTSLPK